MEHVSLISELGLDGWTEHNGLRRHLYKTVDPFGELTVRPNGDSWVVEGFGINDSIHFAHLFTAICWVEHIASCGEDLIAVGDYDNVWMERGDKWHEDDNYGGFNVWTDEGTFTNTDDGVE